MKKNNIVTIIFSIFAGTGVVLILVAAFIWGNERRFRQKAVEVTGEIVEIFTGYDDYGHRGDYGRRISHDVYVTYTFEGETYERVRLNEYSSSMYEGKSITLFCDPDNPRKVKTGLGLYLAFWVVGGIGILFSCIGIIPLIIFHRKKARKKYLLANGRVLHATVERIDRDTSLAVNGQNPYVIYCTWKDEYTDVLYRFKSENLWTDPGYAFDKGSEITVYVDGKDYSRYYVEAEKVLSQKVVDFT